MQAIITRFSATEHRGSVILASWATRTYVVPYERALTLDENHAQAAHGLARKLGWKMPTVYAQLPSGDYCHVPVIEEFLVQQEDRELGIKSQPMYLKGRDGRLYHRRALPDYGAVDSATGEVIT